MTAHGHRHGGESCRELVERLSELLDGELPPELCESVEAHMGDCPPCQDFLESLRRTVRWVGEAAGRGIPDDVRRDLAERAAAFRRGD